MDITKLRRLAREADADHRAAMAAVPRCCPVTDADATDPDATDAGPVDTDAGAADPGDDRSSRRHLLRQVTASVAGAAVAVPLLARAAAAQEAPTTTAAGPTASAGGPTTSAGPPTTAAGPTTGAGGTTTAAGSTTSAGASTTAAAATTTTTIPRRPVAGDVEQLVFDQSMELALVRLYAMVVDAAVLTAELSKVTRLFQRHHQEHADALAGLAGKAAQNQPNAALVAAYTPRIQAARTQEDTLAITLELENMSAATYVDALGQLEATEPAALAASIAPIEARHTVVYGEALNLPLERYVPQFQTTAGAATPQQYPLGQA